MMTSGQFECLVKLPENVINEKGVVDVQLTSASNTSGDIKLDYIGISPDKY